MLCFLSFTELPHFTRGSLNPGPALAAVKSNFSLQSVSQTLEKKCVVLQPLCLILGHKLDKLVFLPLLGERREENWAVNAGLGQPPALCVPI